MGIKQWCAWLQTWRLFNDDTHFSKDSYLPTQKPFPCLSLNRTLIFSVLFIQVSQVNPDWSNPTSHAYIQFRGLEYDLALASWIGRNYSDGGAGKSILEKDFCCLFNKETQERNRPFSDS